MPDGKIRVFGKDYFDTFEPELLAGWIVFYDRMFTDYGYPGYKETADALRAL
jgi:hypothetical protein